MDFLKKSKGLFKQKGLWLASVVVVLVWCCIVPVVDPAFLERQGRARAALLKNLSRAVKEVCCKICVLCLFYASIFVPYSAFLSLSLPIFSLSLSPSTLLHTTYRVSCCSHVQSKVSSVTAGLYSVCVHGSRRCYDMVWRVDGSESHRSCQHSGLWWPKYLARRQSNTSTSEWLYMCRNVKCLRDITHDQRVSGYMCTECTDYMYCTSTSECVWGYLLLHMPRVTRMMGINYSNQVFFGEFAAILNCSNLKYFSVKLAVLWAMHKCFMYECGIIIMLGCFTIGVEFYCV